VKQRASPCCTSRSIRGYDDRYNRLVDWVKETENEFRDDLLADLSVADALIAPISEAAERWRAR